MERYVVITTLSEQRMANTACAALESGGIPVMIEHVHIQNTGLFAAAFRVLVPAHNSQTALKVLSGLGIVHNEDIASLENAA